MVVINILSKKYIKFYSDMSRVYMIKNYLKTYDASQGKLVPFNLFPRQQDLCSMLGNANNVVTTKARQQGITTTCAGFISCEIVLTVETSPITILVIGNTLDLAQQMVTKIRDFLLQFPRWMWGINNNDNQDIDITIAPENENEIFKICNNKELILKNGCRVVARSSGPNASRGVGGVTWLIFDEMAFIDNGKDVYASAVPTVSTGGHIIGISTPNGKDALYYEICRRAKLKGTKDWNNFELVEMKWYHDPRYNKFLEWTRKNEENGEIEIQKEKYINDLGDIKFDTEKWKNLESDGWKPRSPWYIKMCQQFNNDPQKIAQELDVSFLGSDSTVVSPEFIQMHRDLNVKTPSEILKDPILEDMWVWKPPFEGHKYLMSIDNSRGSSDDATALEIIDLNGIDDDGTPCIEQVAEYNGKLTGDNIGEIAYQYGMKYNNAFIVVEDIGGYGSATLLMLQRLGYKNLYYDDPSLKKYTDANEATTTIVTDKGLPGFHSSSVRFQMLSNFADLVRKNQFKIRSVRVCNELDTWVFVSGSRGMDHKDGCHDDTITCLAMGLFVMQYSLNKIEQTKAIDSAMLQAMIAANSTINSQYTTIKKTYKVVPSTIYTIKQTFGNNNSEKYRANMWLLK